MSRALVTAIGSFSSDIVIKKLKNNGFYVVGLNVNPKEWIAESLMVDSFYQAPYVTNHTEYDEFIKRICLEERITHVIPLTDTELDDLNCIRDWFDSMGILLCVTSEKSISIARNKLETYKFGKLYPDIVNIIPTYSYDEIKKKKCEELIPVIAKPINGRSSQGITKFYSTNLLKEFLSKEKSDYIFQPIIEGDIITVDTIRNLNGFTYAVARKELLRTLNGAGTSVYVFHDDALEETCRFLADKLEVLGCVNFEFIQDEHGKYWLIECNPRFSGGVEFTAIAAYDIVANHFRVFDGQELDKPKSWRNQYIARKFEEYVTKIE